MSILDSIMGQMGGAMGQQVQAQVAGMIAQKLGIDPSMAQMAIGALTHNHPLPNDTVTGAAQQTGLPTDLLSQIMGQLGGEDGIGSLASQMGSGAQGQGGLGDMLGGLMGGNKPA